MGDRLFLQRANPDMLDSAIESWRAALLHFPESPRLLGRLAMAYTIRADRMEVPQPSAYVIAREHGMRCLKTDATFRSTLSIFGGELTRKAVRTIDVESVDCLTWTSLSWSRWLLLQGAAGAAIDAEPITLLAERAVSLDPAYDRGRSLHALGLAMSLPPAPLEPDRDAAAEVLLSAMEAAPERWEIPVDLATLVYAPAGEEQKFRSLLEDVVSHTVQENKPDALEQHAAQRRAAAALERGPDRGWGL